MIQCARMSRGKGKKTLTDPHCKKTKRKVISVKKIKLSKCKCICCGETNGCIAKCQNFSQATLFSLFFLFFRLWFDFCMVARKGHYNFLFLLKLSRDNSNLSRDKINSYRATNKKIIAR